MLILFGSIAAEAAARLEAVVFSLAVPDVYVSALLRGLRKTLGDLRPLASGQFTLWLARFHKETGSR